MHESYQNTNDKKKKIKRMIAGKKNAVMKYEKQFQPEAHVTMYLQGQDVFE